MSSLAASRADNFYYPPEWRPEMGGISKFVGSKGKNQYEQHGIIRFELPFDGWCLKCNQHMEKGLRFNAKKDKAGNYFTTAIWSFTMKCYACDQKFVILTDPQNNTYDYKDGIRKHVHDYEPEPESGLLIDTDAVPSNRKVNHDPMAALEHLQEDKKKAETTKTVMESLLDVQEQNYRNDYDMNSLLRSKNRVKRKREGELLEEGKKKGLPFALAEVSEKDKQTAKQMALQSKLLHNYGSSSGSGVNSMKVNERLKMASVQQESIFSRKGTYKTPKTTQPSNNAALKKVLTGGIDVNKFKLN